MGSIIDIEALAAEQAPTRMILSYDGNVNSIEIAFDKKSKSNSSINKVSKKGEVVTYERNSPKRVSKKGPSIKGEIVTYDRNSSKRVSKKELNSSKKGEIVTYERSSSKSVSDNSFKRKKDERMEHLNSLNSSK